MGAFPARRLRRRHRLLSCRARAQRGYHCGGGRAVLGPGHALALDSSGHEVQRPLLRGDRDASLVPERDQEHSDLGVLIQRRLQLGPAVSFGQAQVLVAASENAQPGDGREDPPIEDVMAVWS